MVNLKEEIHILNGDALLTQFPKAFLEGNIIVMRECLVDGDVSGDDLHNFFEKRASFLELNYGVEGGDYDTKSRDEIDKITRIGSAVDVNLWFEDDLFCLVNMWFVANLLRHQMRSGSVFLVRPNSSLQFGFGALDEKGLMEAYANRQQLTSEEIALLGQLWDAYKSSSNEQLKILAESSVGAFPFLMPAIDAHLARDSNNGRLGRPEQSLVAIMKELGTKEFGPVFKEFSRREAIYGFGDLQVKRIWKNLLDNNEKGQDRAKSS